MNSGLAEEATYEVRIRGRLDEHWSDWLDGVTLEIVGEEDGREVTILTGQFDQAGLRGLLTRLWDLNITVRSVVPLHPATGGDHLRHQRGNNLPDHATACLPTARGDGVQARRR